MKPLEPFLPRTRIAYFSMEIAVRAEMHTYSGGLGILAGDMMRSCADLELPVMFVTLASRSGYLNQGIDAGGRQVDFPDPWDPSAWTVPLEAMIAVAIEGREVWIRPWLHSFTGPLGYRVPLLLLDTDLEQNHAEDRRITDQLYGGDTAYRFKQEIVLGIGGVRMLRMLGFDIDTYHMNEGHAALLALELLHQSRRAPEDVVQGESIYDQVRVREMCVFTTHTPVGAGHDRFPFDLVERCLGDHIDLAELKMLGGSDGLNMTLLAFNLSGWINGVARRHAETTLRAFPGYRVRAITNGVHAPTWTHASLARVYDAKFPDWRYEPEALAHADQLADDRTPATLSVGLCGQGSSSRRRGQTLDRGTPSLHREHIAGNSDGVPTQLRYDPGGRAHGRRRHLAQYAAAPFGGFGNQRHEGGPERCAQFERPRWLVAGGLPRGGHRLGDRKRRKTRFCIRPFARLIPPAGGDRPAPLLRGPRALDLDDETERQQDRRILQQTANDAPLCRAGLSALSQGCRETHPNIATAKARSRCQDY